MTRKLPPRLLIALAALGFVLTATVIPGVFTVDDNNYMINVVALRQGRVTVANTEGLTPSRELLFFDPTPANRIVVSTPVASTAPPLYAPLALPFSLFGIRGLVALNTLSFLVVIALVFTYTRRNSTHSSAPWLAASALAFGAYSIEYAQGIWPHMLSTALCFGSVVAASRVADCGRVRFSALSGALIGIATGVRYQNFVLVAGIGLVIIVWGHRRVLVSAAYGASAAIPLLLCSSINHARLGSWNPISKGPGYLTPTMGIDPTVAWSDPLWAIWARVVDSTHWRPLLGPAFEGWLTHSPLTGAHLVFGIVPKKALLQSAPWAVVAIALFVTAWLPHYIKDDNRRRQARLLSVVASSVILTFALFGLRRDDGLSFNQRYLLEVLPLLAVGFGWALDRDPIRRGPFVGGLFCGGLLVILTLLGTPPMLSDNRWAWELRQLLLLKTPLVLVGVLGLVWVLGPRRAPVQAAAILLAGVGLGWAAVLHLGEDVFMSRTLKAINARKTSELSQVIPDRAAVVGYWSAKDAAGPLLLDRDVVILDMHADAGEDVERLVDDLHNQGRRVFLIETGTNKELLARIRSAHIALPTPISWVTELK